MQKYTGANYQGNSGRCHSEKGWDTVWMKDDNQAVSFWSKCYVSKNLKAEIEKKNQTKQEILLKMEGVLRQCIKLLNILKPPFHTVIGEEIVCQHSGFVSTAQGVIGKARECPQLLTTRSLYGPT